MLNSDADRLRVTAPPAWVVHEPYDLSTQTDDTLVSDGLCILLQDMQTDIGGEVKAAHVRQIFRVVTQAGAEIAARFSSTFNPALQHIEVHHIRVTRDSNTVEYAFANDFDLIRREQNLERRMLDGRLTASLIIPDVRSGDIVEQCWTTYGEASVLSGFHSEWVAFERSGPVGEIRYRLRAPAARSIVVKTFGTPPEFSKSETGGIIDRRWFAKSCIPTGFEALTPPWQLLPRSLQISEEKNWSEVATLFAPLFQDSSFPDEMEKEAKAIKARNPHDAAARMLDILRLVRRRLRYFSLSLGEGGLVPRAIETIWVTGYGDCKDASRVFVALAKLADVEAIPALVTTTYGPAIKEWLPSPTIFNHCIVRVRIDGAIYWLDPTSRARENSISDLFNPHLGYALPLTPTEAKLELMPAPASKLLLDKFEKLNFGPRVSSPATLKVRVKYHSHYADWIRELIANQGVTAASNQLMDRYKGIWPKLTQDAPLRVEENQDQNLVTLIADYTILEAWKKPTRKTATCTILESDIRHNLAELKLDTPRHNEIYLGLPRTLRHRFEIQMPKKWKITPSQQDEWIRGLKYWNNFSSPEKRRIIQIQELSISAPTCPANEAAQYSAIVREAIARSGVTLSAAISGDKFVTRRNWLKKWSRYYLIAYAVIVLCWLLSTTLHL